MTAYQRNGYQDRTDYLTSVADDYGIDEDVVSALADVLGESEDFDGLISMLEDFGF